MTSVSVIIPVFNPSMHLAACLQSVFDQTLAAAEVIVVDDGSQNAVLPTVLRHFEQTNLKLITLAHNHGVASARNHGVRAAQGNYLAFIDQDDLWPPQKLQLQVDYLDAHPQIDFVIGRQVYFLSSEQTQIPPWLRAAHLQTSLPGFLPGTLMIRKSAFESIGYFHEALRAGTDDVDWFFRAKDAKVRSAQLEYDFLYKRIHGENLSQHVANHQRELLRVVATSIARQKKTHE
jgi:glycosyltransferase involved in cell wall biosynthesis